MKKLLTCACTLFLLAGCDAGTDKLSCTSTTSTNGLTTETTYDVKYKDEEVKHVTITYHYTQDNDTTTGNNNTTDTNDNDTTNDNNDTDNNGTDNNANARNNDEDIDGVNADTDGTTEDKDDNKNDSDDIVDGAVGDAIDTTIDGVTSTILDIAGIKTTYENQMNTYDNIKGFTYKVEKDTDDEYTVVYDIDFDKISDSDLTRFNVDRDFSTLRTNYENSGYTCK